jgi:membrane protein CcdC involved in cytochrome C biogenesis
MTPTLHLVSIGVAAIVVAGLILLLFRSTTRPRQVNLKRLWVAPVLMSLLTVAFLVETGPQGTTWSWLALALAAGGGMGLLRGKTMTMSVDPETLMLTVQGTPATIIFLIVLIGARLALRDAMIRNAQLWHLNAVLISEIFLLFAAGLLAAQRVEMGLRARVMLALMRRKATTQ